MITLEQLRAVMPRLPVEDALRYLPYLNEAMAEAEINTSQRMQMFIAQLAHESAELRHFEELSSGAAYEGRKDLGNTHKGDGMRYKGRGPIQLTGRTNYRAAGKALGLDLEGDPELAADYSIGFRIAAWFWKTRRLNSIADTGNFELVTRTINGGLNGQPQRVAYWKRAQQVIQ